MGGKGPRIPCTQPKLRGIVRRPLPTKNGVTASFVYTRSSTSSCLYQVINDFLFIPGHQRLLVYTRSSSDSLFIPGKASYSHQWPGCGERFLGRYNADERFLGRLREWRLGEHDPRLWEGSGRRVVSSRPVSGMSTTVGGCSARLIAAASGGAASKSSPVSGQAARGWGSTRPGLKPSAILSSLCGSVSDSFLFGCPKGDSEKESRSG